MIPVYLRLKYKVRPNKKWINVFINSLSGSNSYVEVVLAEKSFWRTNKQVVILESER
jgi:hypothetical protein